jgi:phage FluMu gp28-like protein
VTKAVEHRTVGASRVTDPRYTREAKKAARNERRMIASATREIMEPGLIQFRSYQKPVFTDRTSGILVLHWSRQIGKSFTLASWAVDRLLTQLQRYDSWLITVLSNSKDNGGEFVIKCQDVCRKMGFVLEEFRTKTIGDAAVYAVEDQSPDIRYDNMRMEVRITMMVDGKERIGRIKVLAANPRTARGFSGDLILDEFAFHEDSPAIWDAAEPILSSNPEFLCRIASTGNGKHNMFYRMCSGPGPKDGTIFESAAGYQVSRVARTEAWKQGVKVYDPNTRKPITPDEARHKAMDKRSYDQNYECQFADENMVLLTHELISAAERSLITIDDQEWTAASLARMFRATGWLEVGFDVGRNRDLSVITVIERIGNLRRVIAMLRMAGMRLPSQQKQLDAVCAMPKFRRAEIDMTGIGLGLCEYAQEKWGMDRIRGVNFSTTEPISDRMRHDGKKQETARVTEIMATALVETFEDRSIEIPLDPELREDLRKPEKITSPGGRVSIAATRDEAGHADHFWSVALAVRAGNGPDNCGRMVVPTGRRSQVLAGRRERSVVG